MIAASPRHSVPVPPMWSCNSLFPVQHLYQVVPSSLSKPSPFSSSIALPHPDAVTRCHDSYMCLHIRSTSGTCLDQLLKINFYFKSCRIYSNIGKGSTRTGGGFAYDRFCGLSIRVRYYFVISSGFRWRYQRCLGSTDEYRRKSWPSWFVRSEGATECPGWVR
jgi:hypothetical protein